MTKNEKKPGTDGIIPIESIHQKIFEIRGSKVMLDSDLAELYGVPTKVFNQTVKRNLKRFPEDFRFQMTAIEFEALRSQIVTSKESRGGRTYLPYVFTEQGVAMLSSVLHSDWAIEVNIEIMRAFVSMRGMIAANVQIQKKLIDIENELGEHNEHFKKVFAALRLLMEPESKTRARIGYINRN